MPAADDKLGSFFEDVGPLNYDELPGLEDVYLEDSFVREVVQELTFLSFTLTAALAPSHPAYEPPPKGEKHCFRSAALTFPAVRRRIWHTPRRSGFVDAAGAVDYGNIDRFVAEPKGFYHLEGEWGSIDIESGAPQFDMISRDAPQHTQRAREFAAWLAGRPLADHDEEGHDHDHDHGH
jgi:hypothetical protein